MKNQVIVICIYLLSISSSFGQITNTTYFDPIPGLDGNQFSLNDSIDAVLSLHSDGQSTTFSFVHHEYGTAFWSKDSLAQYLIYENNLTILSSDFDVVSSVVFFIKDSYFQVNESFIFGCDQVNGQLALVDWYSMFCGDHQHRAINISEDIFRLLGKSAAQLEIAAYDGHVLARYYDREHQKYVLFDADPDTGRVTFVADGNGFYVGPEGLAINPQLIYHPQTIVHLRAGQDTMEVKDNFFEVIGLEADTYTIEERYAFVDDRVIEYTLPDSSSARMSFSTAYKHKSVFLDTTNLASDFEDCRQFMTINEPAFDSCVGPILDQVLSQSNVTWSEFGHYDSLEVPMMFSNSIHDERFLYLGGYLTVEILNPGLYDELNLKIPHYLRSVHFENGGTAIINGHTITDSLFIPMYIPTDSPFLDLTVEVYPTLGFNGLVTPDLGVVTATYWINYALLPFWREGVELFIKDGNVSGGIKISGPGTLAMSVDTPTLEEGFLVYPNPVTGNIFVQDRSELYDVSGRKLADLFKGYNSVCVSSGTYYVRPMIDYKAVPIVVVD